MQKSALHSRLRAMSVLKGHRTFHHRSVMVCVKCGGCSTWANRKLRRDCLGNPSKLGMEVLKRMANREPAFSRGKSILSLLTWRRQPGWLWGVLEQDPGHFVPCPIPHGDLARWTRARDWKENGPCPSGVATCSLCNASVFFFQFLCSSCLTCRFFFRLCGRGSAHSGWPALVGPPCLIQKKKIKKTTVSLFFLLFSRFPLFLLLLRCFLVSLFTCTSFSFIAFVFIVFFFSPFFPLFFVFAVLPFSCFLIIICFSFCFSSVLLSFFIILPSLFSLLPLSSLLSLSLLSFSLLSSLSFSFFLFLSSSFFFFLFGVSTRTCLENCVGAPLR